MSFYECDCCHNKINYGNSTKAKYEIENLDLKFCCYDCLVVYFKNKE